MNVPAPMLHVPTLDAKQAALRVAHEIGWRWYDDLDYSLARLAAWSPQRHAETTYLILGGINQPKAVRYVNWGSIVGTQALIRRPAEYTLVNSLDHLRAYAIKHRVAPLPMNDRLNDLFV